MAGQKADMVFTDPPYGVEYDATWRDKAGSNRLSPARTGLVTNDNLADWSSIWPLFDADVIYCWHAWKFSEVVRESIENQEYDIKSQIIWNKNIHALSGTHYQQKHESCWYAVKRNAHWIGDRKQMTVWDHPSPNHIMSGSKDDKTPHPTQKPLALTETAINNHSCKKIADPFGGSGSTLIACEKTDRTCYMSEIDPHYCQVIIDRWESYTGKQAVKE
jgi:DNA modification methylase